MLKKLSYEEIKENNRIRNYIRYHSDEEYRKKIIEYQKEQFKKKYYNDEEYKKKRMEYQKQYNQKKLVKSQ